jgi:hypothetical protein
VRVVRRLVALAGDVAEHHLDGPTDDYFAINPWSCRPVPDLLPSDPDGRGIHAEVSVNDPRRLRLVRVVHTVIYVVMAGSAMVVLIACITGRAARSCGWLSCW